MNLTSITLSLTPGFSRVLMSARRISTVLTVCSAIGRSLILIALSSLCLVALSLSASAADKLKVLVITGGHGFEKAPFFKVFEDNPDITFNHAEHSKTNASAYDRDDLRTYDVVVLYDMPKEITEAQKKNFLSLF